MFSRFGTPLQLLSDRGSEFESELFTQLMDWLGVDKLRTTVFKPSTNGIVERFHRTLNSMLGKIVSESACSNQPPSTIRRWKVPVDTVLLEPSRVLRSAGADRHFSLSQEHSLRGRRKKMQKTALDVLKTIVHIGG